MSSTAFSLYAQETVNHQTLKLLPSLWQLDKSLPWLHQSSILPDSTVLVNSRTYQKSLQHQKVNVVLITIAYFFFYWHFNLRNVCFCAGFTLFSEIKVEHLAAKSEKIIIKSLWNYCAYAIDCKLIICGCLNGQIQQERCFSFEYPIKDIACAENICLILLETGIAYKMNRHTFQMDEINSTIIRQSTPANNENGSKIFGKLSAQHETEPNGKNNEFITHIAASRSLSVIVTSKNNVFNMPLKIHTFPDHMKIKKVSCGNEHCLILTKNGDIYAFGSSS